MNEDLQIRDKYTFGFWLYIMSDCLIFASLFATFAVLKGHTADGPMPGDIFSLPLVLVETLLLLTSSFTAGLAVVSLYEKNKGQAIGWLVATAILGASFVALEVSEFTRLVLDGDSWRASAFLSAFFTLVATHGLHVTLGLVWMLILIAQLYKKGFSPALERRFLNLALFWHFLDIVWIFIFTFVYLIPLVM